MGKQGKKFEGTKLDVKDVLGADHRGKPAAAKASVWKAAPMGGYGAAPTPKAPGGPLLTGKWAKSGPQGLAATATSLNAAARPSQPAPKIQPGAAAKKMTYGLKSQVPNAPAMSDEAFPTMERPKTAAELAESQAHQAQTKSFPDVQTASQALDAVCKASGLPALESSWGLALDWIMRKGLPEAPDKDVVPRDRLLKAGTLLLEQNLTKESGAAIAVETIEAYFSEQAGKSSAKIVDVNGFVDARFFATVALYIDDEAKRGSIRDRLVRRMIKNTTSSTVQRALADALLPVLKKEESEGGDSSASQRVREMCLKDVNHNDATTRIGCALGLSVVAAASTSMRKTILEDVKSFLKTEGKNGAGKRHTGVTAVAELARLLGKSFEPHAIALLPDLFQSCADDKKEVYLAGREASKAVVAQVSTNCLKLMVKPTLEHIRSKHWKIQLVALELFGDVAKSLAEDAAKRLAMVLPEAIPALCEAAMSPRTEIRNAVKSVFEQVGTTIAHRDVAALAPQLIQALVDSSNKPVAQALDALLSAVYTTAIDPAACALICPVVERGLSRGDADCQQKAASFARGLVLHAGENEDLAPFFAVLRPPLEVLLAHPNPGVRSAAAEAIGAIVGDDATGAGKPTELLARLDVQQDGAEAEGTAQGIAAAMSSVSAEVRMQMMEELTRDDVSKGGRLCRLCVFAHLPKAMGSNPEATPTLCAALPAISVGLGSIDEVTREMARRGMSAISEAAKDSELVAALAAALVDALRSASLYSRLSGAELGQSCLTNRGLASNPETRATLIAAAVVAQSDIDVTVRRAADRVWRAATEAGRGTPGNQLKELRPTLVEHVVEELASGELHRAKAAGRAAAQLQERLESSGGFVDALVPVLLERLEDADASESASLCDGMVEVMKAPKCESAILSKDRLSSAFRRLLVSGTEDVSSAVARCSCACNVDFVAGPFLKELLEASAAPSEEALQGLRVLMSADANGAVVKTLLSQVPQLDSEAVASCLEAAAAAPAPALCKAVQSLATLCIDGAMGDHTDGARRVMRAWSSALDKEGLEALMEAISSSIERSNQSARSRAATKMLGEALVAASLPPAGAEELMDLLLPGALAQGDASTDYTETLRALVQAATPAELAESALPLLAAALRGTEEDSEIPGATFDVLVPVLQAAFAGSSQRLLSVETLHLLVRRAGSQTVSSHALKLAGPYVRALGDKASDAALQEQVLLLLAALLELSPAALKALKAPLATSFAKALEAQAQGTRSAAASACAALAPIDPKVVVKVLTKAPLKAANMEALAEVMIALPDAGRAEIQSEVSAAIQAAAASDDSELQTAGRLVAGA